jgi:predicted dehydrogenase
VQKEQIGQLDTIQILFACHNMDPNNIRNKADAGGGGLMDIGCYPISLSRFLFDKEPERVCATLAFDPNFHIDRLTTGTLDFGDGIATFTCGTQLAPYQRVNIIGTEGRIEFEIPFNAPPDQSCRIWHQRGTEIEEIQFEI